VCASCPPGPSRSCSRTSRGRRGCCTSSAMLHRRLANDKGAAQPLALLGAIALQSGDRERGRALLEESAELAGKIGWRWWRAGTLSALAEVAIADDRIADARGLLHEAVGLAPHSVIASGSRGTSANSRSRSSATRGRRRPVGSGAPSRPLRHSSQVVRGRVTSSGSSAKCWRSPTSRSKRDGRQGARSRSRRLRPGCAP
jgi:hypothetical protein